MTSLDLFSFPEELSRTALVHWLELSNVFQLDSAFCSNTQRLRFLSLAYCQRTIYAVPTYWNIASLVRWSVARKAKVDGIDVNSLLLVDEATRTEFLAINRSSLRRVSSSHDRSTKYSAAILQDIAKGCHEIQQFDLWGNYGNVLAEQLNGAEPERMSDAEAEQLGGVAVQVANGNNLKRLALSFSISQSILVQTLQHCSNLTHLTLCRPWGDRNGLFLPHEAVISTLKYLSSNYLICDSTLVAIGQTCTLLESLTVNCDSGSDRHMVTTIGVEAVLEGCLLLRHTDMYIKWTGSDDL
jgi:hypothetical protein